MKIAIIDDERPARSELKYQLSELLPDAIIEEGDSGAAALQMAGEKKFDIFFGHLLLLKDPVQLLTQD